MKARELINHIITTCKLDDHIACILWGANDVLEKADELGVWLEQDEADQLIDEINNDADCNIAFTWDTIEDYILIHVGKRGYKTKCAYCNSTFNTTEEAINCCAKS